MSRDGNPCIQCIQCDKYVSKCFCATMICTECAESNMGFVAEVMKLTATHPLRGRVTVKNYDFITESVYYEYDFKDKAINHGIDYLEKFSDWKVEDV